jgi:hypothetical protein
MFNPFPFRVHIFSRVAMFFLGVRYFFFVAMIPLSGYQDLFYSGSAGASSMGVMLLKIASTSSQGIGLLQVKPNIPKSFAHVKQYEYSDCVRYIS